MEMDVPPLIHNSALRGTNISKTNRIGGGGEKSDGLPNACPDEKMLDYRNVHRRLIYLITSTLVCPLCVAVQSGCCEGQQSSKWLPARWMMGTGGADPAVIRTLS